MFYLIIEDEKMTGAMKWADVFEPFKFIGEIVKVDADTKYTAKEMVERNPNATKGMKIIGAIVRGESYIAEPEKHKVISDGKKWSTIFKTWPNEIITLLESRTM